MSKNLLHSGLSTFGEEVIPPPNMTRFVTTYMGEKNTVLKVILCWSIEFVLRGSFRQGDEAGKTWS